MKIKDLTVCVYLVVIVLVCSANAHGGKLVAWGDNRAGQCNVPAGDDYIAVAAGYYHGLALKADGTLVAWGSNTNGQNNIPTGNDFIAIGSGGGQDIAIKSDHSLASWGGLKIQFMVPSGNDFSAVSISNYGALLKTDGSILNWTQFNTYPTQVLAGNDFIKVSAGGQQVLGLRSDGTLDGWVSSYGQQFGLSNLPTGHTFTAIAAGGHHSMALANDGSVVVWGENTSGQCNAPAGQVFSAIAAGNQHSVALRSDGSLAAWGSNYYGQCNIPSGNDFTAIAGGYDFNVAIEAPEPMSLLIFIAIFAAFGKYRSVQG